jgi:N-acyl-D-amino-acid deacylase
VSLKSGLLAFAALGLLAASPAPDYDLVIRGGRVLDGAGSPWVRADVAVKDGRIVKVGSISGHGAREIDAKDHYVSPGFIDMMDQSGEMLRKNGAAENKLRMGVTTVIAGEGGTPVEADQIPAYFAQLEQQGIAVNFGTYYATSQARVRAMGDHDGRPTPAQLAQMKGDVDKAMKAGVFGISTALIYPPSSFSDTAELIELAKVSAQCHGYYVSHIRNEGEGLLEAIDEAIAIGEKSGAKVEIFHLKSTRSDTDRMARALVAINAARDRGVDVAADMYPYVASGTGVEVTIPNWIWKDGEAKGFERLADPALRDQLKREIAAGPQPGWSNAISAVGSWKGVILARAYSEKYSRYDGRDMEGIAKELGVDPVDLAIDIQLAARPKRAVALYFMMKEKDLELALHQPWTSIGSDAGASEKLGVDDGLPHPRGYGTFPRVIAEYVKRRHVLTLEEAVRKMTAWPAQRMGLQDRGLIREGMRADITIFDLDKIDDVASWARPMAVPVGIETVIVNGKVALDGEKATGVKPGQVLRHACS